MSEPTKFQTLFYALQLDNSPLLSPERFAQEFALEQQQLASYAHVHRNTVSRSPRSEPLQNFMRDAVRVVQAASNVSGDTKKALYWFRNQPLQPFGYKTADVLVSEGKTEGVLRYLDSLDAGAAG